MLMLLIRAAVALVAAVFGLACFGRVLWLAASSSQTVGAEILAAIGAMLVYAFNMPNEDEMQQLDKFIKSKKENAK